MKSYKWLLLATSLLLTGHAFAVDTDRDTLPDDWELSHGRNPATGDYAVEVTGNTTCVLADGTSSCGEGITYKFVLSDSETKDLTPPPGLCRKVPMYGQPSYYYKTTRTLSCATSGNMSVICISEWRFTFTGGITGLGAEACPYTTDQVQQTAPVSITTQGEIGHIAVSDNKLCALTSKGVECWTAAVGATLTMTSTGYANYTIDADGDGVSRPADVDDLDASRYQNVRHNPDKDNDSDVLIRSASLGTWTRYSVQNNAIVGSGAINAPTSSDSVYVAQLDANGDGDADILTRSATTGAWTLSIVENGAVTSSVPLYLYANLGYVFVGVGDFNNDGTDDVMLRHATNGYRVFLLANHAVSSSVYYNAWTGVSSVDQGIGDFNGDGTDDLLVRRTSDNLYFIFKTLNGAVDNYYCACNIWANPDWTFQFAGDTNKDGKDDIVIRGTGPTADGKWWAFRMNNFVSSAYSNLNLFINKTAITVGAVGDYNGDGNLDVLTRVNNSTTYVSPIVNGTVTGNYWLYNFTADQVIGK